MILNYNLSIIFGVNFNKFIHNNNNLRQMNISTNEIFNSKGKNEDKFLSDFYDMDTSRETRIGLVTFTRYCGPGSRLWNKLFNQNERTFRQIDYCCKTHDECPHFVERAENYERYPGLEYRPQFFSRYDETFTIIIIIIREIYWIFLLVFWLHFTDYNVHVMLNFIIVLVK